MSITRPNLVQLPHLTTPSTATTLIVVQDSAVDQYLTVEETRVLLQIPVGPTGPQGPIGYFGSFGFTGSQGEIGYWGSTGYTGSSGYTGSQGYTGSLGYTGSFGFTGSVGYTGSVGFTGSQGITGFTGSVGYTGSLGPPSNTATNILGGSTGSLVVQTGTNNTGFIAIGGTGTLLQSNGTSPVWVSTTTLVVGYAANSDREYITQLSEATTPTARYPTLAIGAGGYAALGSTLDLVYYTDSKVLTSGGMTLTNTATATSTVTGALVVGGGVGVGGNLYVGGNLFVTNGIVANTATNIAGGLAGQLVVQTGTGFTGFVSTGTIGTVLVSRGTSTPVFQNTLTLAGTDATSSTNSGALQVAGGVGVGGSMYVGGTVTATNHYGNITTINISTYGTNADLLIDPNGTGAAIFSTATQVIIYDTATSISTTTGALIVKGGVGIGGNVYIAGELVAEKLTIQLTTVTTTLITTDDIISTYNTTDATSTSTGALIVAGGAGIGKNLYVGGLGRFINTTPATSTTTGAVVVGGGMGIGGAVYINTTSFIAGSPILTAATVGAIVSSITAGTDTAVSASTGAVTIWNTSTLQTVTGRGATTTNAIVISNITSATSTATGALIVAGGVGIGGAVYINTTSFIAGSPIITAATIGAIVSSITAGTDTAISTSTGAVTIWNTSTLQTVTGRGNVTTNAISITNTTTSANSTSTGALVVTGGVGVGKNLTVQNDIITQYGDIGLGATGGAAFALHINTSNGSLEFRPNTYSTSITTSSSIFSLSTSGGATITSNPLSITTTTVSVSSLTGALLVAGGAGIRGDLWVGGNVYVLGTASNITSVNVAGGGVGQILFQSATSSTSFVGTGTAGQILISNGAVSTGPTFVGTNTITIGTATTLAGGTLQSIHYQSNTGTTAFLAASNTSGWILSSNGTGSAPSWVAGAGSAGSATTATYADNIKTLSINTNAEFYPTFVDTNNATGIYEPLYTTSTLSINPSTGKVTVTALTNIASSDSIITITGSTSTNQQLGLYINNSATSQYAGFRIAGTNSSITQIYSNGPMQVGPGATGSNTDAYIQIAPGGIITFNGNSGAENGRFTGGAFMIGTTSTTSKFEVNGAAKITGNFTATGSLTVGITTASTVAGEIRATNEITAYYSSDARLKENIQPIDNPIAMLEAIRGVYFDWTADHIEKRGGEDGYFVRKHDIGVIAQEVEKILPEIVATRADGFKAVKYEKIVPLLIEAIKAQQAEIEQMKKLLK